MLLGDKITNDIAFLIVQFANEVRRLGDEQLTVDNIVEHIDSALGQAKFCLYFKVVGEIVCHVSLRLVGCPV